MPPRLVGLYALALMEREGAVHGYLLSRRIAERTQGAWRPSPGTVYPSLNGLVERGLARRHGAGRRREYRITPAGRAALRGLRRRAGRGGPGVPDLSPLWAEVAGVGDVQTFLLRRLRRTLDAITASLGPAGPGPSAAGASLRAETISELSARLATLRGRAVAPAAPAPRRAGRSRS